MMEFNDTASQLYALLGRADESVALLRELAARLQASAGDWKAASQSARKADRKTR